MTGAKNNPCCSVPYQDQDQEEQHFFCLQVYIMCWFGLKRFQRGSSISFTQESVRLLPLTSVHRRLLLHFVDTLLYLANA